MVPLRDGKFKIMMVLRSILVLDRTYTQVESWFLTVLTVYVISLTPRKRLPNGFHFQGTRSQPQKHQFWKDAWDTSKNNSQQRELSLMLCRWMNWARRRGPVPIQECQYIVSTASLKWRCSSCPFLLISVLFEWQNNRQGIASVTNWAEAGPTPRWPPNARPGHILNSFEEKFLRVKSQCNRPGSSMVTEDPGRTLLEKESC